MKLHTYLNYGGNCEEALRFYEKHLGGKIVMMMRFSDQPEAAANVPPGLRNGVLHARMMLGDSLLRFGTSWMIIHERPMHHGA